MERNFKPLLIDNIVKLLIRVSAKYAKSKKVRIVLAGGLAMIAYGKPKRSTLDVDAEIITKDPTLIEKISKKFQALGIPIDISDNISRWGMVDLPPAYQKRAQPYQNNELVEILLLSPLDLIISKLRIFRDNDIEDINYLVKKFKISYPEIKREAKAAIQASPRSTEVLFFKKNLKYLGKALKKS